jgi:type 1 fimbriae regulatory protein FimB
MTFVTPVETLAVLKVAKQRSTRDWAMILLAYRHGLRASEVCRLKLADIDQKAGSISIRRLKGSLLTVQPLFQHRGQPLLDETAAIRAWFTKRPADGSNYIFTRGYCTTLRKTIMKQAI